MKFRLATRRGTAAGPLAAVAALGAAAVLAGCGSSSAGSSAASAPAASAPAAGSSAASSPAAMSGTASPGTAATGQQITITGTDMLRFTPMTVHAHTGKLRITLRDMGAYPHNIVIPGLHVTSATVTGDPGSSTVSFTVNFPRAGHYAFHCQYHVSSGMVGTFVVS